MTSAAQSIPRPKSEAYMRKNTSFAIAATMLGLAVLFWAKSSVVATSADISRPKIGMASYQVMPSAYLPIQVVEPTW
jgi:hypothetical protein